MASQQYTHDWTTVTIENCLKSCKSSNNTTKTRLPKGSWDKKLQKINKKIKSFKISDDIEWLISINNQTIKSDDIKGFERIISSIPPPLTLQIVEVNEVV